ncbi:MAG TPA: hypothetical protein VJ011_01875, partial [Steroidobacteraceae bacterium]|nr:hypothetical protein [Steroidobacteraceae bacterium]
MSAGGAIGFAPQARHMLESLQSAFDPVGRGAVSMGGLAFPLLALAAVLVCALIIGEAFSQEASRDALRIELESKRSWWDVRYESGRGRVLAHELRVPVGHAIELVLSPKDSFWGFRVPELAAHADVVPGRPGRVFFVARNSGVFRVQGTQLHVVAAIGALCYAE